ncbi:MAG: 50S ribosomal protein L28 [Bacteroidales bacterium]|nr:50S ribosomal protein L28 [Bacteroidales bacterium]MCF8398152.1 50S ribosomal protein L28 [Bacteroidales bacterium]
MAKVCEITGKRMITGHKVSHSNVKNKRWFYPNLHKKKFYIPEEDKWINLTVSSDGIRTINKKGILNAMKVARQKGYTKQ